MNKVNSLVAMCSADDLPDVGSVRRVDTEEGEAIAVFNVGGDYYAVQDLCTHDRSSLSEDGWFDGDVVECGWHMAKFDVRTGAVLAPPAPVPLRTFDVVIADGVVRFTSTT